MALRSLNNPIASFIDYLAKTGTDASIPYVEISGLTATGGVISDYTDGPAVYRAHIFTSSGTFDVSSLGTFGSNVEMLLIGGGGGGGAGFHSYAPGAGGGGGGWVQVTSYPISTTPGSYPISVGAGGVGGRSGTPNVGGTERGTDGTSSTFTNPSPQVITAAGGGGAGGIFPPSALATGNPGGSGGGGGYAPAPPVSGGTGTQPGLNPGVSNITQYGFDGGTGDTSTFAGGGAGGGAGGTGTSYSPPVSTERSGGSGRASVYAYGPTNPTTYAAGGPANGPQPTAATNAAQGTGDGGMASRQNIPGTNAYAGGSGGSGIVVVRYQIGQLTATAKATGGAISYSGGKTIHTFIASGTFSPNPAPTGGYTGVIDYVIVAGGGGGGGNRGGGGGAGGLISNHPSVPAPLRAPNISVTAGTPVSIQVGGGGVGGSGTANTRGATATPSYIGPTVANGGGGGGCASAPLRDGLSGGSGGGGSQAGGDGTGGTGNQPTPLTPPQGNSGGNGNDTNIVGGGGGGFSGPGAAGGASGGAGGPGIAISINPQITFDYAAGGGGGARTPRSGGSAGSPSAGAGGSTGIGSNALQSSGSGGGGGGDSNPPSFNGGSGGSGIVIIAYPS